MKELKITKLDNLQELSPLSVSGLNIGEKAYAVSRIDGQAICVLPDILFANNFVRQLTALGVKSETITTKIPLLNTVNNEGYESYCVALSNFVSGKSKVLVVSPEVLMQRLPNKQYFAKSNLRLKVGQTIDIEYLKKKLLSLGYSKEVMVSGVGQFACRGDIVDVFVADKPYRIHLFDDEIEQINTFDISEYKAIDKLNSCVITNKSFLNDFDFVGEQIDKKIAQMLSSSKLESSALLRLSEVVGCQLELGKEGMINPCFVLPFCEWFGDTVLDYCDTVVFDEPKLILDRLTEEVKQTSDSVDRMISCGEMLPKHKDFYSYKPFGDIDTKHCIAFSRLVSANKIFLAENFIEVDCLNIPKYIGNYSKLAQDIEWYRKQDYTVVLCCGDGYTKNKIKAHLGNLKYIDSPLEIIDNEVNIINDYLPFSMAFEQEKLVVISTGDLTTTQPDKPVKKTEAQSTFLPKPGEYVVHQVHGVGKCVGIQKINITSSYKDYVVIEYKGGDILYVPTENMDVLSAYLGSGDPRCNKIGGEDFFRTKQKAKESIKKMAFDLVSLYATKEHAKGYKYSKDSYLQTEFENAFPYEYTADQQEAIRDIKHDMESNKIIDRLICGDVGFGKTEVALVAAYKAILDGKQVAIIAPTTILCEQHYNTALSRMKNFMVNVEVINRLKSQAKQKEVLDKLSKGKVDLIVGTHRLLSKDVVFKDLGLLILDEEQRFGVEDKETLRHLKKNIDVISLSATPIPRTLYMSLSGIRDISYLNTPPKDRQPVATYVIDYSDNLVYDACRKELDRDGQVLIVYNRVETIYEFASKIKKMFPEENIAVAHGQMQSKMLEDVIYKVYTRQSRILVSTVLIENGIDLPYANTLIVIDSDKLGLSQLYQLKGRIGRSNISSTAYFTFAKNKVLTQDAYKRLDALMEFTKLGSGLKVAMQDLQIRGAGNILGREQHGHMDKIGYDLYFKLLEQAVRELKGETVIEKRELKIDVSINAYISDRYIPDENGRIVYYSKIAGIIDTEGMKNVLKLLEQTYGPVPQETEELCKVAYMKNLASNIGASKVVISKEIVAITLYKSDELLSSPIYHFACDYDKCSFVYKNEPKIIFEHDNNVEKSQQLVMEFLQNANKVTK